MKKIGILIVLLMAFVLPVSGQAQPELATLDHDVTTIRAQTTVDVTGVSVTCPNGVQIQNGVEMVVNMRAGFSYTATALGIGDFDPVIAITDGTTVLCNDDSDDAISYGANLPTTGVVAASPFSARSPFSYNGSGFGDISVIVGSFDNRSGEFVLLIEGLAVTNADGSGEGAGDPFSLHLTPNLHLSGVPATAYMISVTSVLDPLMTVVNSDNEIVRFDNGDLFACDDAGTAGSCWGENVSLAGFAIARGSRGDLGGFARDAYISIPLEIFGLGPQDDGFITWRYTSYQQGSFGDYVAVFHLGTTAAGPMEIAGAPEMVDPAVPDQGGDGPTVTGRITEDQPEQVYNFTGKAGDSVTITMLAEDTTELDTRVFLYTAEGYANGDAAIAENDDAEDRSIGAFNSQIVEFALPDDGDYVVVASRLNGEGAFTLTVEGSGSLVANAPVDGEEIRQWASSATGTSQYGTDGWSFSQATGEPNTPECGDFTTAWASGSSTGSDTLALEFDQAVIPTQINIHQTYTPGSIIRVEVANTMSSEVIELPNSADPPGNTDCPGVFTLDVSDITTPVDSVLIYVDQTIGGNWNEIDAVELVGIAPDAGGETMAAAGSYTADSLGVSFNYPENWVLLDTDPVFIIMLDSMATIEGISADTPSLEDGQFVLAVMNVEQYTAPQETLLDTNIAVIEALQAEDGNATFASTERVTLGDRSVLKTRVDADGLDSLLYVADIDGTYIVVQASAGNMGALEPDVDTLIGSLSPIASG